MIPRSPSVSEGVLEPNEPAMTSAQEQILRLALRAHEVWVQKNFPEYETAIPGYFTNEEPEVSDADAGDEA